MTLVLPYYMLRFSEGALKEVPLKFEVLTFSRLIGLVTYYVDDPQVVKIDR